MARRASSKSRPAFNAVTGRRPPGIGDEVEVELTDNNLNKARKALLTMLDLKGPSKEAFTLAAPVTAPLKYLDGGYKNKPMPEADYLFTGAYFGKTGDLIFNFTPADAQDFAHAELKAPLLTQAFPAAVSSFMEVFIDELDIKVAGDNPHVSIDGENGLPSLIALYLRHQINEIEKREGERAQKKKAEETEFYKSNADWGMF